MATVGKKFVDPDWLEQGWFVNLSPGQKLLYFYMWTRLDHAGVIEFVPTIWSAHIGQDITEESLNKLMNSVNQSKERIIRFGDKIWFTEFIRYQQKPNKSEPLSGTHNFTKTIVNLVKQHGLYEEIKKRDPILFQAYEKENGVSDISKPSPSLSQGLPKGKGKGQIKGRSNGKESTSNSLTKAQSVLNAYPKKNIEGSDISVLATIEDVLEDLKTDGIKEPETYLLNEIEKLNRRDAPPPGEYFESLKQKSEVPF